MKRVRDPDPYQGPAKRPVSAAPRQALPPPGQMHPSLAPVSKLTTNDALSYLREVKNRFQDQKEVYDTFLEIMKEFKAARIDTTGVIHRVKQLFRGHRELILGFNTFLPKGYEIELARIDSDDEEEELGLKQPVEFDQAINYVNKIKTRFHSDERVYKAFLEILNMYRKGQKTISDVYEEVAILFKSHHDLLEEFTYFLPDNTPPAQGGAVRRHPGFPPPRPGGRPGQPQAMQPSRMRGGPLPPPGPGSPGGDMRSMHKRKTTKSDMFRHDDDDVRNRPQLAKELAFFEKVKARIRNKDAYNDFLKCLGMYSQDIISRQELMQLVNDIIGRFPDLMNGFHDFVAKCDMMEIDEAKVRSLTSQSQQKARQREEQMLRDKFLTKPLSEIVANETERVTPSYVKMPPQYPHLACSNRCALANTVLNNDYVNVITGSEDYSFKLMRKNQYEEALFRCEDDRYEFEMAIERNAATIKRLRPVADKITAMNPDERANYRMEDTVLGAVHWRCIERLYADQGPVLVDLLKKNPSVAVPVVLVRLEQKDEEWRRVRVEMTRVWKKIYEGNYHKSLDHRSFYFKQAEKRALLPKTLVSEVREAADKRKQDERALRALSLAFRYEAAGASGQPADLTYDYLDKQVFMDAYRVMRTAIDESLGSGHREQVLELYLGLVEPFFGLQVRQEELERLRAGPHGDEDDAEDAAGPRRATGPKSHVLTGFGAVPRYLKEEADVKSESSDQDMGAAGGKGGGDETMTDAGRGSMDPDTAGGDEGGPGEDGGREDADDDTSADIGKGEDSSGQDQPLAQSSDAHADRAYQTCKPLVAYTRGPSPADLPAGQHLLFGNENIYVFFRYHRILYERLTTARKCAQQVAQGRSRAAEAGGEVTPEPPSVTGGQQQHSESAEQLHEAVMDMLCRVMRGQLESSLYEDQCRSMLGTNSYELFTLDKLSAKIVKHMQLMLQDDTTQRLWELFKYERSRGVPINATIYHVNCHALLSDDTCYKITYQSDAQQRLNMTLVDPDKAPEAYSSAEGYITDYIRSYVSSPTPAPPADQPVLYLKRNLNQRAREGPDAELVSVLRTVSIFNGLECKISCATSKVSYVLDTEDVMCRKLGMRRMEPEAQKQQRVDRFTRWLEDRAQTNEALAMLALAAPQE